MLGLLQLILAAGRQALPRSVDIELHHPNGRAQSFRSDLLGSHHASNRLRVFRVHAFRRIRRNRFDLAAPAAVGAFAMRFRFTRFFLSASSTCGSHFPASLYSESDALVTRPLW